MYSLIYVQQIRICYKPRIGFVQNSNPNKFISVWIQTQTMPFKPNRSATSSNRFITCSIQNEESPLHLYIDKSLTWFFTPISSKKLSTLSAFLLHYFSCEKECKTLSVFVVRINCSSAFIRWLIILSWEIDVHILIAP